METSLFAIILLILGLALGAGAGWFFGSRPVADLRVRFEEKEGEVAALDEKFRRAGAELGEAQIELSAAKERASRTDSLQLELEKSREENAQFRAERAGFAEKERLLKESQERLLQEFENTGAKVLSAAQEKFAKDAADRLGRSERVSEEKIKSLLNPVGKEFETLTKKIKEIEEKRVGDQGAMEGLVKAMNEGQQRVIDGAHRIETTLRGATKARGDWGELQFENLLDSCGLRNQTDFKREANVKTEEGRNLRPDAVINIPGGRKLVVDVKNVFNTYQEANEAETEEQRGVLLSKHAKEVRAQIQALSAKRYQDYVDGSADFVVMFVPGEHVLYAALMQDDKLLSYALEQNVVLSSPLNFMSIALTVATVWRQAGAEADAKEIAALGKELYDRLGVVAGHLGAMRKSLHSTNQHFDRVIGSFDTNLRKTGERFEQLSVDTSGQDLSEALPLNAQPRALMNFDENVVDEEAAE